MTKKNGALVKSGDAAGFDPSEVTVQQFSQLAEIARVELDAASEILAALGAEELNRAEMSALRAGAYFLKLKQQAGHGNWLKLLDEAGVGETKAIRSMQIARYVASLPAEQARRIALLPKMKILPLTRAEPEVVGELLEAGKLDGEGALSVRELMAALAKEQARAARAELDRDTVKNKLVHMQRASTAIDETEFPPFARAPRHETFAFEAETSHALDGLELIYAENLFAQVKHPEVFRFQPVVAANCDAALGKIQGRIAALREQIRKAFPDAVTAAIEPDHQLTANELALLTERCERMKREQRKKAVARADERANTQAGRRGRRRV